MSANYVNIDGGTTFVLNLSDNQSFQNNQIRLICKTLGGAITIQLPKISDIGNSIDAKIFVDDGEDNSATNNITIVSDPADTIQNGANYLINTNGGKIEIYIASKTEYGVIVTGGGSPSSSAINVGKTIYVDSVFGDDTTGLPYRQDKPFLTIGVAQSFAVSGDTIIIRGGSYVASNIGADGVTYHFEEGATLTSIGNCFNDFGANSFSVTGYGKFYSNSAVVFITGAGYIYFEGLYAEGTGNGSRTIWNLGNGTLVVNIKTDLVTSGKEQVVRTDGASCKTFINCNRMIGAGGLVQNGGGEITICRANEFIYNASGSGYVGISCTYGNLQMYGNHLYNGVGLYGLQAIWIDGTGNFKLVGDIDSTNTDGTFLSTTSGKVEFYGKINSTGFVRINSGVVSFYDDVVNNNAGQEVITHSGGKTIIHSLVKNLDVGATSYGILVDGAGLILKQMASIYLSGVAECIYAVAPQTIKTYTGAVTNALINVNISELVSSIQFNVDVDSES